MNRTFQIKDLKIKNRLAVPPMVCFYMSGEDGYVTERNLKHYEVLAAGGFGLIIVEATAVTKRSRLYDPELGLWEDGQIAGFKELTDRVHKYGAKVFIQLLHAGINGVDTEAETASDIAWHHGITGHEMSIERIHATTQDFVDAAVRAEKAGFDGIELHGCHGYLFSQFMNSRINHRTDAYGEDKTLFARETLEAIRAAVSPDFIVGIRLGVFEPVLEDGLQHAQALAPYTDFLDVSYGGEFDAEKPEGFPCSEAVYGASKVKELLPDMPVFGVDKIDSKKAAELALATGIDMADIGRAALVDPAFANHVINGEPEGKCLHCKNGCRWNPDKMSDSTLECPGAVLYAGKNG